MKRQEHYNKGGFFIRKRQFEGKGKNMFNDGWAIYISREFGSWRLVEKYSNEEDCDWNIEQFVDEYGDQCIVE